MIIIKRMNGQEIYKSRKNNMRDAIVEMITRGYGADYLDLRGIDLSGLSLSGGYFSNTNFEGANLSGCNLSQTTFERCNFYKTNFEGANLTKANLCYANIAYANFKGAKFEETYGINVRNEVLPDGTTKTNIKSAHIRPVKFSVLLKWYRAWNKTKPNQKELFKKLYLGLMRQMTFFTYCGRCRDGRSFPFLRTIPNYYGLQNPSPLCTSCEACTTCCRCVDCPECETRVATLCEYCSNCTSGCCSCTYCSNCDVRMAAESRCRECGYCSNACCGCVPRKVNYITNELKFHSPSKLQRKLNQSARFISAEIEVSDVEGTNGGKIEEVCNRWSASIVHDGSLPKNGFEINTAPAGGDLYIKQIGEICEKLESAKAIVDTKCGLHVHIDARDFSYYDIRRLVKVYAKIEDTLFKMVPESRQQSHYCKPCGSFYENAMKEHRLPHKELKGNIIKTLYGSGQKKDDTSSWGKEFKRIKKNKYQDARYYALNIHSWFFRGTVECRLFNGTINASKIISWGMLWTKILEYALHSTDSEINKLPLVGYDCLIEVIRNDSTLKEFIDNRIKRHTPKEKKQGPVQKDTLSVGDIFIGSNTNVNQNLDPWQHLVIRDSATPGTYVYTGDWIFQNNDTVPPSDTIDTIENLNLQVPRRYSVVDFEGLAENSFYNATNAEAARLSEQAILASIEVMRLNENVVLTGTAPVASEPAESADNEEDEDDLF